VTGLVPDVSEAPAKLGADVREVGGRPAVCRAVTSS